MSRVLRRSLEKRWSRVVLMTTVLVMILTACAWVPEPLPPSTVGGGSPIPGSTSPDTPPTTLEQRPILGLITPTGIPVALSTFSDEGYVVHSPCGGLVEIGGGQPVYQTTVVLDPGHGGPRDIGAVGQNGLQEKVVNLQVASETQRILTQRNISSILTRTDDYTITLASRARLADTLEAELMVSIHHNAPTPGPSSIPGNEVFYQSTSEESRRLGGLVHEYSIEALGRFDIPWTRASDAGVMMVLNSEGGDTYGILRHPETPTVLLELGFLSNPVESQLFATPEYVEVAATGIADAIEAYLSTDEPGSGWVSPRNYTAPPAASGSNCVDPNLE